MKACCRREVAKAICEGCRLGAPVRRERHYGGSGWCTVLVFHGEDICQAVEQEILPRVPKPRRARKS